MASDKKCPDLRVVCKDVGRIVRELWRGLHLSDLTEPFLGAASAVAVCRSGEAKAAERAGGSANPGECRIKRTWRRRCTRSARARAGDSGSHAACREPQLGGGREGHRYSLAGPPGTSRRGP
ncbi:hypothetical protein NDU88_011053 [Pleurodeles waltl]|uniref:Uncharacterized protein n=1 Tax=Pleurodeles waltl TaxID=8319 RepID=A0AAV7S2Z5_PLEWA|nr:hypothetical protein NDU88_011053 [Pleurodeles waltl]